MALFRQKTVARGDENGVWEARQGFWSERGGFVLFLRDIAMRWRVVRVLRGLRKGRRVQDRELRVQCRCGVRAKGAAVSEARHRSPRFWFPVFVRILDEFVR